MDEQALYACCKEALASTFFPIGRVDLCSELATDSLVEELLYGALPSSEDSLNSRVGDLLFSLSLAIEASEVTELCRCLWKKLQALQESATRKAEDTLEDLPPGCCELCERRMPLVRASRVRLQCFAER